MAEFDKKNKNSLLSLVSDNSRQFIQSSVKLAEGFQLGLFPNIDPSVISFFHVSYFMSSGFIETVTDVRPSMVIDMRAVPSFSPIGLKRESVLSFMERFHVDYYDVAGLLGSKNIKLSESSVIASYLSKYFSNNALPGPAVLLFDNVDLMMVLAEQLPFMLSAQYDKQFKSQVFVGQRVNSSI
jgi:hypothetical protein